MKVIYHALKCTPDYIASITAARKFRGDSAWEKLRPGKGDSEDPRSQMGSRRISKARRSGAGRVHGRAAYKNKPGLIVPSYKLG
jgi:hypothetical protein